MSDQPQILVVDDEPRNIRLLEGMLYGEPYHIVTATHGAQALAMVQRQPPDLILLDIMMPDISGYDVCRQIKSTPDLRMIPIVMVTALHEVGDRVKAMEAGADDFLSKPIDATELIVRVRSLVRMRQLYTEIERITAERLRFMAGVAHDIRSPLNALKLNLQMIADKSSPGEDTERYWARANSCIDRISILASDVMNYYRSEAEQLDLAIELHPIEAIVTDAADIAIPIAEEGGMALNIGEIPKASVPMDAHLISQVLLNLLTNAIKYSAPGSEAVLSVYDIARDGYTLPALHYPPVLTLPVSGFVFEVRDQGQGIDPADYARVFGEFDRLQAKQEGVGLGLPVSQRLVRMHGGEIWFSSTPGAGSTFAFFLPEQRL